MVQQHDRPPGPLNGADPHQISRGQTFRGNQTFRETVTSVGVGLPVLTDDLTTL